LKAGSKVMIEAGPLTGLEGIFIEAKGGHRLVLSVTLLQRSVAVEIDSAFVRPVQQKHLNGSGASTKDAHSRA
jgi:transcription antitermination factor NusG